MPDAEQEFVECIVCKSKRAKQREIFENDRLFVKCPRCGKFNLTASLLPMLGSELGEDWRWILSYWIRNRQSEPEILIDTNLFEDIVTNVKLPSLEEQSENLILYLGNTLRNYSDIHEEINRYLTSVIGAKVPSEVDYIADYLKEEGYINFTKRSDTNEDGPFREFGLTFKGWSKLTEIKRSVSESRL